MNVAAPRRWPLLCAAFAAIVLFIILVARFWHPVYGLTALIQLDAPNDNLKIPAFREHPVYVHRDTGGYDGLYYAQIAYDPLLKSPELPRAMDNLSYRARRILPPAVAWLLAAGHPAAIVHIYSFLNVVVWLLLAALLWRLLKVTDFHGWLAWAAVLFSCGALSSVRLALTDLPMTALLAAALFSAEHARPKSAIACAAAAALARETALIGTAGLFTRPWISLRNFATGAVVAAPLFAWLAYIRWRVGPADAGWANLTLPATGLIEKTVTAFSDLTFLDDSLLAGTTLFAVIGIITQSAFFVLRWRLFADAWWRVGAAYTALMLTLGTAVWEGYPGAFTRVLLPLTLAFNVLAHRTRAAFAWLVFGNLGFCAGFLVLRDFPVNTHELFAGRTHGAATVIQIDSGWFGAEHSGKHVWSWSSGRAQLDVESWSDAPVTAELSFTLRALAPRTVIIRRSDQELWRGPVSEKPTRFAIPLHLVRGHTKLEFSTDTPATRESPNADARALAFALYDPSLSVPTP
ncbi:MAG: hypothetical protein H7343_14615 [Undibacterium sp.]|nr:hypothetical protein [Opitutaceae bacterium]